MVFSVCQLLVDSESPLDVGRARYWCERAEQLFPHHPAVFRLKEHLLTADGEEDAAELEALIACKLREFCTARLNFYVVMQVNVMCL
jgi:hypothetical protein